MHKVVTINLNGQAYQFDEDAYAAAPRHPGTRGEPWRASYYALGGSIYGWDAGGYGLISAGLAALFFWFAYQHVPDVRNVVQRLPDIWESVRRAFAQAR
jgi:hypothetical protein